MRTKFLVIDYGNDVHRVPIYEGEARTEERARKNTIRRMRNIWLERTNKRTNIERRKEKGTERTHFRISCSVDGVAAFSCCSRNDDDDNDEERRERRGVEAMRRKRRDDEKEVDDERRKERRDIGRMVYQTGWFPSLFRIRMRIRLTYSCTGTTFRYPSYSLFAFCPDVRALYDRASAFGRRKRIGREGFGEER